MNTSGITTNASHRRGVVFGGVSESNELMALTPADRPLPFRVTIFDQSIAINDALLKKRTDL